MIYICIYIYIFNDYSKCSWLRPKVSVSQKSQTQCETCMYKFPSCETCQDMRHATRSTPGPGAVGVASASEHVPAKPPPMGDEVCLPKSCSSVSEQKDQDCRDSKDSIGLYRTGLHNTLHKFFTMHFILWVCHSISRCSCCPAACIPWGKFTGGTTGANASSA